MQDEQERLQQYAAEKREERAQAAAEEERQSKLAPGEKGRGSVLARYVRVMLHVVLVCSGVATDWPAGWTGGSQRAEEKRESAL